jgi:hypothetical protein
VDGREVDFGQVAERDAALIGHDDDGDPGLVQPADGGSSAGQEVEVVGGIDEGGLVIDDPVSIQEYGRPTGM